MHGILGYLAPAPGIQYDHWWYVYACGHVTAYAREGGFGVGGAGFPVPTMRSEGLT